MSWNRITQVAAALLVTAAIAAPVISASVEPSQVRVGGDIKEPKKIKDVKPVYPEAAKAAGVQGIVIIETRIATDGTVNEAKVLRSVPELDRAAIDAVMQWKYTPTLLNGQPVEVIMTVTVTFTLQ
jgi:protein TonB